MEESREMKGVGGQKVTEIVKNEFQKSPLGSNIVFALLLVVLEKLMEMEFECPCRANLNAGFAALFFFIPGILAFLLMTTTQETKCSCDNDSAKRILHCIIPAFVWAILLLFDGRFLACAMTYWSGRYVTAENSASVKWCEPANDTLSEKLLMESQGWYFHSQWAGFLLASVMSILIFIIFKCTKEEESQSSAQKGHGDTTTSTNTSSV